jgi:hypothetical protein
MKMPELIVMLTHHDVTVANALELFTELQDLPILHWGFKDRGLPTTQMRSLVEAMRAAGKTTYLEVVSLSEAEGLAGARLALEAEFDVLMGTVYFSSIQQLLSNSSTRYYPFVGHVHSHPSILDGDIDKIAAHAHYLETQGVDGLDLLTYRYTGDAPALLRKVVTATALPVVSAGSIASLDRVVEVQQAGAWGFTVGSAFFEARFSPEQSIRKNVEFLWNALSGLDQTEQYASA